jgi:(p)ppGpp synthase/HD superfamily hydrolase
MLSSDVPDHAMLMAAVAYSAEAHRGKKRKGKGGLSYIYHPISVTNNLIKAGIYDLETLIAALLHDVIEDTDETKEDIKKLFGEEVAELVDGLTDEELQSDMRKAQQIEVAKGYDWRKAAVRISDKIDNLNDIVKLEAPWSKEKITDYANFTVKVINAIPDDIKNAHLVEEFENALTEVRAYIA